MTAYLVDQSIWSRIASNPEVAALVSQVAREHVIVTCPPQVMEYCHTARNPSEFQQFREYMNGFFALRREPAHDDVLDVQQALWDNGLMRAAGAIDVLIAAYAIANDATVLSVDRDFDAIARATGGLLRHQLVDVG